MRFRTVAVAGARTGWVPGVSVWLLAMVASNQTALAQTATINVTGHVVNATTGAPVARALVNLNSRAVLTDSTGKFEFPSFTPNQAQTTASTAPQAYIKVTKPGYSSALDAMEAMVQQPITDVTIPLEIKLYPNALISGVVVGGDRQPLAKVQLTVYREMDGEIMHRLVPVGSTQTNSHGEYRFDQGGGRYAVGVGYSARGGETGEAVLPQRFPETSGSDTSTTFVVNPGEDKKVDLQVKTGVAYPVTFQATGGTDGGRVVGVMVRMAGGTPFMTFAQPTKSPGEFRIDLPSGSYQLHVTEQSRERRLEADGHVTVMGRPVNGLVMHFAELPSIPIQVIVDTSSNATESTNSLTATPSSSVPTPQTLNLYLRNTEGFGAGGGGDVRLTVLPDKTFAMQPGGGTYRLASQVGGQWFVERASYGTTDLLTQNLTVAPGTGADVIRVTVSSATGQVAGTVRQGGVAARGYVYLIPHDPGLTPLYTATIGSDGTYQMKVPPGSYTVVAFDHRFAGDLTNQAVAGHLVGGGQTTVTPGAKASLDLELQRVEAVQ